MKNNLLLEMLNLIGRIEGKTLVSELEEVKKGFSKSELNEAMIVEKQHVAAFKYNKAIDNIVRYIRNYILIEKYTKKKKLGITGGWWKFSVPKELTSLIDFVANLRIDVEVEDFKWDEKESHGSGVKYTNITDTIVGDVLDNAHIVVRGVSFNRRLNDYSIRNNLYHELSHAYETYCREKNLKNMGERFFDASFKQQNIIDKIDSSGSDEFTNYFSVIYYRLFDKSELSAAASSTYAYLKTVNGKRGEILKDIRKTQAYQEYQLLKSMLRELKKMNNTKWWDIKKQILWGNNGSSPQEFKNWFLLKAQNYLKKYFHYMMSAAASYYDDSEEKSPQNHIIKKEDPKIV